MSRKRKIIIISSSLLLFIGSTIVWASLRKPEFELDQLHLYLEDAEYDKLSDFRDIALDKGLLERSKDDFVSAKISYLGQEISGKTRLKGDWTDHLAHDKWSFRIKLDQPMQDGLQVFSVQNPGCRDFMNGFVYHQLLKEENILTNEYRFIELLVNDESWGIYSLEEHLTSRLFTNQNRSNGVILKFKDEVFFEAAKDSLETNGLIKAADIKVYGDEKKQAKFKGDVQRAEEIIEDYKFQKEGLYDNFDSSLMGKYYALCDLTTAYHAMGWINIRFFYCFETQKMEPIGYDAYPILEWGKPYLGKNAREIVLDPFQTEMIVYNALNDTSIYNEYIKVLDRISRADYVDEFMKKYQKEIKFYEGQIQREYSDYKYNYNFIKDRATEIREARNK
jgi:CotH kinase protein